GRHRQGHQGVRWRRPGLDPRRPGAQPLVMTDTASPGQTTGDALVDLLNGFIVELREAGLPVSLTENLDAMQAVRHIPLEDREAFKYALAATLVKNNAHWRAFETVFEVYFSLREGDLPFGDGDIADADELLRQMISGDPDSKRAGGGLDNLSAEQLAE